MQTYQRRQEDDHEGGGKVVQALHIPGRRVAYAPYVEDPLQALHAGHGRGG